MSVTFYPAGWLLDVPNPGYGELLIDVDPDPKQGRPLTDEGWGVTLDGAEIGEFLVQVTSRAAGPEPASGPPGTLLPPFVTPGVARALLPALQQAAILAIAGTDRYERVFPDADEAPHPPLCSRCGEGTCFSPGALPSQWCDQHGHQPFGMGSSTAWDSAQASFERHRVLRNALRTKP